MHKEVCQRLGIHEAGHYVVARVLGFDTGSCVIDVKLDKISGGSSEITLWRSLAHSDVRPYLEDRIQVLMAGVLAQSLCKEGIDNDAACAATETLDGRSDYGKTTELIQLLRNIRFPDTNCAEDVYQQLNGISEDLWTKSHNHVLAERPTIEKLGEHLAMKAISSGGKYTLKADEINKLPAIKKRFGI